MSDESQTNTSILPFQLQTGADCHTHHIILQCKSHLEGMSSLERITHNENHKTITYLLNKEGKREYTVNNPH